jgi:hypothetical protein
MRLLAKSPPCTTPLILFGFGPKKRKTTNKFTPGHFSFKFAQQLAQREGATTMNWVSDLLFSAPSSSARSERARQGAAASRSAEKASEEEVRRRNPAR